MKRIIILLLVLIILMSGCKVINGNTVQSTDKITSSSEKETTTDFHQIESVPDTSGINTIPNTSIRKTENGKTTQSSEKNTVASERETHKIVSETISSSNTNEIMKAVWISFYEMSMQEYKGGTEEQFRQKFKTMFEKIKSHGLNTVFAQVRPYSDSFYPSKVYPWSELITGVQGKNPGYDPLKIIVELAHEYSIKVHAWINPFRVSKKNDLESLSDNNIAKIWLSDNDKSNDSFVFRSDLGIYFNPSVPEVHALIFSGVREIIENYDIDGIHIDDYFYPTVSEKIDKVQYESYCKNGGSSKLADWRRGCINSFVSGLYSLVKAEDKNLIVSISPSAKIDTNYNQMYADVVLWSQSAGYTDYIIPQIYFGFKHEKLPFKSVADEWNELTIESDVKLVFGLAQYKSGTVDEYAGSGKNEWIDNKYVIEQQISYVKQLSGYYGYSLFSYGYL